MSIMSQRGDRSLNSASLLTTLTDFSNQREFTPFLQNDFIDAIESETKSKGILESFIIARTFSFLRSNDLIYTPAIKSYMMGEAPPSLTYYFGMETDQIYPEDGNAIPKALMPGKSICKK